MKYRQNRYGNAVQVVSESDGKVVFFRLGGGFQQVMPTDAFYAAYDQEWEPRWRRAVFGADWMDDTLKGWSNGKRWNGWAVPFLELEQALEILKSVPDLKWHPERDCFEHKDEHEEAELVTYQGITINVDGRDIKVYQIGDGWCWDHIGDVPDGD